jgi:hypothetical protein
MNTIRNTLSEAWESLAFRVLVLGLAIGAVPFYFLSMAVATVRG